MGNPIRLWWWWSWCCNWGKFNNSFQGHTHTHTSELQWLWPSVSNRYISAKLWLWKCIKSGIVWLLMWIHSLIRSFIDPPKIRILPWRQLSTAPFFTIVKRINKPSIAERAFDHAVKHPVPRAHQLFIADCALAKLHAPEPTTQCSVSDGLFVAKVAYVG